MSNEPRFRFAGFMLGVFVIAAGCSKDDGAAPTETTASGTGGMAAAGGTPATGATAGADSMGGGGEGGVGEICSMAGAGPSEAAGGEGATSATMGPHDFAVFEQEFTAPGSGYVNPWEEVTVTMTVTSPSGHSTTVGGFYYSGRTYKARFRPDEAGTWKWYARLEDKQGCSRAKSGTFKAEKEGHGFIRQSSDNPNRWKWEDKTPFYGLGLQSGMPDAGGVDQAGGIWGGLDLGNQSVNLDTFLSVTAASGINMFRWTADNGAPGLWTTIAPSGNVYKEQEAMDGDRIVSMARKYGFAVLFTFFNFWMNKPPYFNSATLADDEAAALQRYAQYLIDRYGAYIDIWEVINEGNASPAWYAALIPYLKQHDPYQHDVSTSTVYTLDQNEFKSGVTLNMVHWYAPVTEWVADEWTYNNGLAWIDAATQAGAPSNTIVGETGNCCNICNYEPNGFRLRGWTAFFAETILIYWDRSGAMTDCGDANTNYYIGEKERAYAKILQDFTAGFDPKATKSSDFSVTGAALRGYSLSGPSDYALYLVNPWNHNTPNLDVSVNVSPKFAGHATWINPSSGTVIGEATLKAGAQDLDVPNFTTDIALKIHKQ